MPTDFSIQNSCALLQSLIVSHDEKRDELGKELHNNVNQLLASARLLLEMAKQECTGDAGLLDKGLLCLDKAITDIRKINQSLNSAAVEDLGLEAAIGQLMTTRPDGLFISHFIDYDNKLDNALSPALRLAVYRIIQEQLANVFRHADAQSVCIALQKHGRQLYLCIADDGKGFDPRRAGKNTGMGFIIINNRVAAFDGTFELSAAPGRGCRVEIEIPLQ